MELKKTKIFAQKNKRILLSVRLVLFYWILSFIAINSGVFDYGITKSKINAAIIIGIILYHTLAISFVPGLIVLWLFERHNKKKYEV